GFLVFEQSPEFVGVFLGAERQDSFLIGERQGVEIGRAGEEVMNLLRGGLGGRDLGLYVVGRQCRRLRLLFEIVQSVQAAVILLVVILEFGLDLGLVLRRGEVPDPGIQITGLGQILRLAALAVGLGKLQRV